MTTQEKRERTNMASEYFAMSALYRHGKNPSLTLGNKKSIDIILHKDNSIITVDVKAIRGKTSWLLGAKYENDYANHYVILVTYLDRFDNSNDSPECWIIPATQFKQLTKSTKKGLVVNYVELKKHTNQFKERWDLL